MVFCNTSLFKTVFQLRLVTILILIDGFLQYVLLYMEQPILKSHNPYFNRWFSAMKQINTFVYTNKKSQSLF